MMGRAVTGADSLKVQGSAVALQGAHAKAT